jgi:trimethylamine--corrinoid protein Co-methyltransferase
MVTNMSAASLEKSVMDDEIVGMAMRVLRGLEVTEDSLAADAIHRVGPGGHYLMDDHTVRFMRSELFRPPLADRQNRAMWEEAGKKDARARAVAGVGKLLQEHQPPGLLSKVDAAVRAKFNVLL